MHIHKQAFTSLKKKITDCLIYCILSNGEVIKYHKFISVVVIELSFRCLNTGPEDRLCGCIYTQELEVWSLNYMYMPHNQKLKCHHCVMTL